MARSCNSNVPFCCFRFDCLAHSDVQTRTNAHAHIRAHARAHTRTRTHRQPDISVGTVARDRKTMGSAELERVAVALPDIVLHAGAQNRTDARIFFSSFYLLLCFVLFSFVFFFFSVPFLTS